MTEEPSLAPDKAGHRVSISSFSPSSPAIKRPPSRHNSLPFAQYRSLVNAAAFAESIGHPFTHHFTFAWRLSEGFDPSPRQWMARQAEVFRAMSDWLNYRDQPVVFAWVREVGGFGPHTHVLLHLDPQLRDAFHSHLLRAGRFNHQVAGGTAAICITPNTRPCMTGPAEVGGLLRYLGKHLSSAAQIDGASVMAALGIDDRGRGLCPILGKRSGMSGSIGPAARQAAGWRERSSLYELLAVLDGETMRETA